MKKFQTTNIAFIGNQNCGKTTFFNALTGKNRKTGNFPGVTVEKTSGFIKGNKNFKVFDLPGLYSLSTLSQEEKVTLDFLKSTETDVILNIVDSTNIKRNLFLTFQLTKLNKPMVIIFNMKDELDRNKIKFDIEKFSKLTGILCMFTSAKKGVDIPSVISLIKAVQVPFTCKITYKEEKEIYPLIDGICSACLFGNTQKVHIADKILLHKFMAFPLFFLITGTIFISTFFIAQKFSAYFFGTFGHLLYNSIYFDNPYLTSFVRDGIVKGIISVLSFLPVVLVLFFFLSLLEDSGYMARIAYITDRLVRKTGLSGKAFFPLMLGFGCSVPAVMATRTLSCDCEKKCALKFIPFISCSAKLPVYLYICNLFFKESTVLIILLLYVIGIIAGSFVLILPGVKNNDFLLELPPYRIPSFKSTLSLITQRTKEFLTKVFSVIVLVSAIIWFMSNFNFHLCTTDISHSMLAEISEKLTFLFQPLGLGDRKIISALICGIGAKEAVISALSVLSAESSFNTLSAMSFLIFVSLYTPCISTIATIKKESKSVLFTVKTAVFQFIIAWCASFVFYSIALAFCG